MTQMSTDEENKDPSSTADLTQIVIGAAMAVIIFRSSIRVLGEAIPQLRAGNA